MKTLYESSIPNLDKITNLLSKGGFTVTESVLERWGQLSLIVKARKSLSLLHYLRDKMPNEIEDYRISSDIEGMYEIYELDIPNWEFYSKYFK